MHIHIWTHNRPSVDPSRAETTYGRDWRMIAPSAWFCHTGLDDWYTSSLSTQKIRFPGIKQILRVLSPCIAICQCDVESLLFDTYKTSIVILHNTAARWIIAIHFTEKICKIVAFRNQRSWVVILWADIHVACMSGWDVRMVASQL